jgi:FAD-dependent sensor of blue light
MYRIVYVSSATEPFSERELEDLLEKSRQNNSKLGITGMLLYKDGNFMQCLEGPEEAVGTLAAKIKSDPRHRGVLVLLQGQLTQPEFSHWAMGFKRLDSASAIETPSFCKFLDLPLTSEQFQLHPSRSLKLLCSFKRDMR